MLLRALRALAGVCLAVVLMAAEPAGVWLDVPFVKQEKDGCGAASIAMVIRYWRQQQGRTPDASADAEHIQDALYSREAHGIYASAVEGYFQQQGFRTFAFRGDFEELQKHLKKGRPLMVALKPSSGAALHYVVVAGLDPQNKIILVNDPARRKLVKQQQAGFEKEWSAAGKWSLLAVPQAGAP